jgi:hypothetical protein
MKTLLLLILMTSITINADVVIEAKNLGDKTALLQYAGKMFFIPQGEGHTFNLPSPSGFDSVGVVETNGNWSFYSGATFTDGKTYLLEWKWNGFELQERPDFVLWFTTGFTTMFVWVSVGWGIRAIKGAYSPILGGGLE